MRIAVVSDIHGNPAAFEAVLADLRHTAPDLILHGGDLTVGGSSSACIVDQIRDLGWPGVTGNTNEMLVRPERFEEFAATLPGFETIWVATREIAEATREALGDDRLEWLRGLPYVHAQDSLGLVHASPASPWNSPTQEASDDVLQATYAPLQRGVAVYGHIHRSFVRSCPAVHVINSGSVSLSFDGDPRASYLLLDGHTPNIRRVEYSVDREVRALASCGLPHSEWMARTLTSAAPQMP